MERLGLPVYESDRYQLYWPGIIAIAFLSLVFHLTGINNYGYFRDELYYLACSNNLAWGYVDHPPLSIFILKLSTSIFGESLFAVRLPGLIAGFTTVILFAKLVRALGGDERSQVISATFAAFAPVFLVVTHLYSMNGLDLALWAWAILTWIKTQEPDKQNLWILLGIIIGLALLNKLGALLLVAAIPLATLLTDRRTDLFTWRPWAALAIAALIFSPHLLWQSQNDFASLQFIQNATQNKMLPTPPGTFLLTQLVVINPLLAILALLGLYQSYKHSVYRPQAIAFTAIALVFIISQKSRENYLAPAYAFIVPVGAMYLSLWLDQSQARRKIIFTLAAIIIPIPIFLALPILPPQTIINLANASPVELPQAEKGQKSPMQGHADMFGWPEMTTAVNQVWNRLPEQERQRTPVLGLNYGQSSAIQFFNRNQRLAPQTLGRHNNWWLWGPSSWDGQTIIIVGNLPPEDQAKFSTYKVITTLNHPYAVPEEATAPIAVARGLKPSVPDFWQQIKLYQ